MSKIVSNAKLHVFCGVTTHLRSFFTASKTMCYSACELILITLASSGSKSIHSLATHCFSQLQKKALVGYDSGKNK